MIEVHISKGVYASTVLFGLSSVVYILLFLFWFFVGMFCFMQQERSKFFTQAIPLDKSHFPRDPLTNKFIPLPRPPNWLDCRRCIMARVGFLGLGLAGGAFLITLWPDLPLSGWRALVALFTCGACQ